MFFQGHFAKHKNLLITYKPKKYFQRQLELSRPWKKFISKLYRCISIPVFCSILQLFWLDVPAKIGFRNALPLEHRLEHSKQNRSNVSKTDKNSLCNNSNLSCFRTTNKLIHLCRKMSIIVITRLKERPICLSADTK